jgi:hypothetical protein
LSRLQLHQFRPGLIEHAYPIAPAARSKNRMEGYQGLSSRSLSHSQWPTKPSSTAERAREVGDGAVGHYDEIELRDGCRSIREIPHQRRQVDDGGGSRDGAQLLLRRTFGADGGVRLAAMSYVDLQISQSRSC